MKKYSKHLLLIIILITLTSVSCKIFNIGGAGWDYKSDVEDAKHYPTTESNRISLITEEVPYGTFEQNFETVFKDFPYSGNPISSSLGITKTQINGTPYSLSYENYVLKVFRDDVLISERKLPKVFYMHPISSGVMLGESRNEDIILCRTQSRATTGLHYIFIADGNGEILFEKVMSAGEDWDILVNESRNIIIGGARTKTTIFIRK